MLQRFIAQSSRRSLHTSRAVLRTTTFKTDRPAPPRLPPHLQKEFEELQRKAMTPMAKGVDASSGEQEEEEMHPDMRRKPKPEFEGDVNPKTGEVGGPKNDPLGYAREWSYAGRATDF